MDIQKIVNAYRNPVLIFELDKDEKVALSSIYNDLLRLTLTKNNDYFVLWNDNSGAACPEWRSDIFKELGFVVDFEKDDEEILGIFIKIP